MTTFGSLLLNRDAKPRAWIIECEPQVRIRLKRVFARVTYHDGILTLTDTAENCLELEWFLSRYPLDVSADDKDHLESRKKEYIDRASRVQAVFAESYKPPSFKLALPPREYQSQAADLILRTGGTLIADDVGLGKTCEMICTLTDPSALPALVVTLTHLTTQWQDELHKFAPKLRTHIVKKGTPYDIDGFSANGTGHLGFDRPDVLIMNYHKLAGWQDVLAGKVASVIFDECQELRRPDSQKYEAATHIASRAKYRSGASATPIYNFGGEMHSILEVLRPDALGSLDEFTREWGGSIGQYGNVKIHDPRAFGAYLRREGLMLRRTRAEVNRELPPLTKVPHHIDCDTSALDKIKGSAVELCKIILAQGGMKRGEQLRASEEFSMIMRQATGIAKAPYAAEFVRLLVESGEKVVVFAWHRAVHDLLGERLKDFHPVFYTGEESPKQKNASKAAFVDGSSRVLVISLRAGAGLDGLQEVCRTCVVAELDWSPGVHEQNVGRIYRDGQRDPVMAYFLIADHGSDPTVADVLGLKRQQSELIRDPDASLIEKLDIGGQHVKKLAEAYLRGA